MIKLPYTTEELQNEHVFRRALRRLRRIIGHATGFVYAPSFPMLEEAFDCRSPDGAVVFVQMADRLLRKLIKNHGLQEAVVGIYDQHFTEWTVKIMDSIAESCRGILVFTERIQTAAAYGERVFERTGVPVCICRKPAVVDVLFAVDACPMEAPCGIDLCGNNPEKAWVRQAVFQFIGETEEMNGLFDGVCDMRTIAFLLQSGAKFEMDKNLRFVGYTEGKKQ